MKSRLFMKEGVKQQRAKTAFIQKFFGNNFSGEKIEKNFDLFQQNCIL